MRQKRAKNNKRIRYFHYCLWARELIVSKSYDVFIETSHHFIVFQDRCITYYVYIVIGKRNWSRKPTLRLPDFSFEFYSSFSSRRYCWRNTRGIELY